MKKTPAQEISETKSRVDAALMEMEPTVILISEVLFYVAAATVIALTWLTVGGIKAAYRYFFGLDGKKKARLEKLLNNIKDAVSRLQSSGLTDSAVLRRELMPKFEDLRMEFPDAYLSYIDEIKKQNPAAYAELVNTRVIDDLINTSRTHTKS